MSWLSKALHSQGGNSLFSFLVTVASELVEANNPAYAPILQPVATALQTEIASLAAGNAPTPHVTDPSAAAAVTTTTTTTVPAA